MTTIPVKEVLQRIAGIDPSRVEGLNAVALFDLSGEGGGKWTLKIADGEITIEEGETAPPNVTLSMAAADFVAMSKGELNPVSAFMQGKIKVSGDMGLAMRLQSILT